MASLLIRSIRYLVTCDDKDQLLEDVDLYCEDGFIRQIGPHLDVAADRTIDASHMLCYPGLVNTHHHLYQVFSRNLPQVQNMEPVSYTHLDVYKRQPYVPRPISLPNS